MGQPVRLEENFVTNLKPSTKMTPRGSRPRHFSHRKPPFIDSVEDELARDPGSVKGPHLGSTSSTPSYNPILCPDLVPALILALIPAPTPAPVTTNELFKKFMKAYLKTNQGLRQPPMERKQNF